MLKIGKQNFQAQNNQDYLRDSLSCRVVNIIAKFIVSVVATHPYDKKLLITRP